MKLSITLSLLLGMATLFQGCNSTEDETPVQTEEKVQSSTTVKGSTTLLSILHNKATVCLDLNDDNTCNENEPATHTNEFGQYQLEVDSAVEDGTQMIVQNGVNMLPAKNEVQQNFKFFKSYQNDEIEQNINIFSTLVTQYMTENPTKTYPESVQAVLSEQFGNSNYCSSIDTQKALSSILDESDDTLVTCMASLQNITYKTSNVKIQNSASVLGASTSPNALDADIEENADYYDSFLSSLDEYIEDFFSWWDSIFEDDTEVTPPVTTEPEVVTEEPKLVEITRQHLNGIWYIIDASGDRTCADIRSNDDIAVTETNGDTTDLTLTFDNVKKTMLLKLGFFTADTINFDKYYETSTTKKFTGSYESDGESLEGLKMSSLETCKSEKL